MSKFNFLYQFKKKLFVLIFLVLVFLFPLPIFIIVVFSSKLSYFFQFQNAIFNNENKFIFFNTFGYLNEKIFYLLLIITVFIFCYVIFSLLFFAFRVNVLDKKKYKTFFLINNFVLIVIGSLFFSQIQIYYNFIIFYCENLNPNQIKSELLSHLYKLIQKNMLNVFNLHVWIPFRDIIYFSNFLIIVLLFFYFKTIFFISNETKNNLNSKFIKNVKNNYLDSNFEKPWYKKIFRFVFLPLPINILISICVSLFLIFIPIFIFIIFVTFKFSNYFIISKIFGWQRFLDLNLNQQIINFKFLNNIYGFNFLFFTYLIVVFWAIITIGFFIFCFFCIKNRNYISFKFFFFIIIFAFIVQIFIIGFFLNANLMINFKINQINIILQNNKSSTITNFIKANFNYSYSNHNLIIKNSLFKNWSLIFVCILLFLISNITLWYNLFLLKKIKNLYLNSKNILYLF